MHDESGAGKILYIEPIEVLEASNRQKELEMERDREMLRILKQLTKQARLHVSDLKLFAMQMGIFDFIRSKGEPCHQAKCEFAGSDKIVGLQGN